MSRLRLLTGVPPYDDPWHPFAETSAAAADVLRAAGHEVEVRESTPEALADLGGVDLLVVNCGRGVEGAVQPDRAVWAPAFERASQWLADGGVVLGLHTAANTFHDWPDWTTTLGGRWVGGRSFHPPLGDSVFEVAPGAHDHPVLSGLSAVEATDERYSAMVVDPGSQPLLQHHHEGTTHVMCWANDRAVYSGLGHDARSYSSPTHRTLLTNAAQWLLSLRD